MNTNDTATQPQSDDWTFFSNYGHVLACLVQSPQPTTREIALKVGITERAVQRVLARMAEVDIVNIEKIGRCNKYSLNREKRLRHPLESHRKVGDILEFLSGNVTKSPAKR